MAPAHVVLRRLKPALAISPALAIVLVVFVGCIAWTVVLSFTSSRMLPSYNFVGLAQYERLFDTTRWNVSLINLIIFGTLYISFCLVIGILLAIFIDQKVRGEAFFRTFILFPYSMSYVVTGLAWQWFLNPALGLQKLVRDLGWTSFTFDWIINADMAIYTIVIAAVWHGAGFTMVILLAGLRGIDGEIWKASRIDGIPTWRTYVSIVLPAMATTIASAGVLLSVGVVRSYDIVVAMTNGGPGIATELPAKFLIENMTQRSNVGLAAASATVLLVMVAAIMAPAAYARSLGLKRRGHA